jgi:hypothetical protein
VAEVLKKSILNLPLNRQILKYLYNTHTKDHPKILTREINRLLLFT